MGLAIASMVLGILGLVLSLVLIGAVLGVAALIFGILHLRKKDAPAAMAGVGAGLGALALVASAGFGVFYYKIYQEYLGFMDGGFASFDAASWEGVTAPEMKVETLDGEILALGDLRGRRVVLNFWATWCPPCVREIPHFVELSEEAPADELVIVGISDENRSVIKKFAERHGVSYPLGNPVGEPLPPPFGNVVALPTTFFIDRNGLIQSVREGYLNAAEIRELAMADDFEGEPREAPRPPVSELEDAETVYQPVERWSRTYDVAAMEGGDWNGDGRGNLLLAAADRRLRVLDGEGEELEQIRLPGHFSLLGLGRNGEEVRLLGHTNWGHQVVAMDGAGQRLWRYRSGSGVNGAHWGDLTGDGRDELIAGMNGGGGLHAVSPDGERLWRATHIGNVWNQAVIPATGGQPARIFATEAGGSVRVFDAEGTELRALRPLGQYSSQLAAGRMDANGRVQIIAQGDATVAFDETGEVAWHTPAQRDHGAWRGRTFALGDLTGDGVNEWVFRDIDGTLAVVNPDGGRVASLTVAGDIEQFTVVPAPEAGGLLAVFAAGQVRAFALEPAKEP